MAHCSRCGAEIECGEHVHGASSVKQPCPLAKGALWVRVLDEKDGGVRGADVSIRPSKGGVGQGPKPSQEEGLAVFDPLDAGDYTVTLAADLPPTLRDRYKTPERREKFATVTAGEIASLKFRLIAKKPKIEVIDRHDFLELLAGAVGQKTIEVRNSGEADLELVAIGFPAGFPAHSSNTLRDKTVVKPGATVRLEASFAPAAEGDYDGDLTIESTDPDTPVRTVKLVGKATRVLRLVKCDPQFAPSVENLDIEYEIQGFTDGDAVELSVRDKDDQEVYKRPLANGTEKANGTHTVTWDGKCADGKYANPGQSPLRVRLYHSATRQGEKDFEVKYHSLHLEAGDWLPKEERDELETHVAGQKPDFAGADPGFCAEVKTIRWTWYQLASQGYYPGPHVGARSSGDALGKAIRRFRQATPQLYRPLFTVHDDKSFKPNPAALAEAEKIDGPLLKYLAAGAHRRTVMTDATVLEEGGAGKSTKLFADVDRFYYEDELKNNRMMQVHKEWVLRPVVCLKATVTLTAKDGGEVKAKHATALGEARVKWSWADRAQVTGTLPVFRTDRPGRVKEYVDQVLGGLGGYAYKGARTTAGGIVDGANRSVDDNVVFGEHDLYEGGLDGTLRWSGMAKDADKYVVDAGSTQVFFRPSTIGGDNYKLTASVEAGSFRKSVTTGEVEVWRRVTVGAYLQWGSAPQPSGDQWDKAREHFRHAFVELAGPLRDLTVATLPAGPKRLLEAAINTSHQYNYSHYDGANERLKFSETYWFSEDPRSVEFAATPEADHRNPANIVNVLLIDTMAGWLQEERNAARQGALSGVKARKNLAAVWQGSATPWIQAVGNHFQPEFLGLETRAAMPANRKVRRIAPGALVGIPTNRAAILDALFWDAAGPAITEWRTGAAVSTANKDKAKALGAFLAQVKSSYHSTIMGAVVHYRWLLTEDNYIGKMAGTALAPTFVDRTGDIEVRCPNEGTATRVASAHGAPTFTATIGVKAKSRVVLTFVTPGDRNTFDYAAFRERMAERYGAGMVVLRGPSADPAPRYAMDDLTDARLDEDGRERLYDSEKAWATGRLANALQMPMTEIAAVLDTVVRHDDIVPEKVPGGTVVVCGYATHAHPVPIKVGIPSLDIADFSNPQNICKDGGLVLIARETDMDRGHLYAHEIAHALFLTHWQQMNENILPEWSVAGDHDLADNNCIMSYSKYDGSYAASHFGKTSYLPEFCGKCNLKLRGWDLAGLPESSRALEPEFPLPAAQAAVATTTPDLAEMHRMMLEMIGELGITKTACDPAPSYPEGGAWMRLYAGTTKRVVGGITQYERTPEAITQLPSNRVVAATTEPYVHKTDSTVTDANLLKVANEAIHSSWEEMLYFVYLNGGSTNPPSITLNGASARFFDAGTVFHEANHLYQAWDNMFLTEGIVDILGAMLASRFEAAHGAGIRYFYNQSYLGSTQFVADELLPRMGLTGAAQAFFVSGAAGLETIVRPGMLSKEFAEAIKRGPDGGGSHSYEPVRQLLLPEQECPEPEDLTPELLMDLSAAIGLLHDQLDQLAGTFGVPRPSSLGTPDAKKQGRERVATMARLKYKFDAYKDQREEAKRFRRELAAAPDNGRHRLVHRSAPYIETKQRDMEWINRMYMACGGADLAP